MSDKPWKENWVILEELPGGGHGYTHKVRHKDDDGRRFVLKTLKKQTDSERRTRMHLEATALQALDHPQIARVVESNTSRHGDKHVPLYMITEFVEGQPMSSLSAPVGVKEACVCLNHVLDAVEYCHQLKRLHRDLKPDNVILRNNNITDPVIIDFGQTFNADIEHEFSTDPGQHLGNRFIQLPEFTTSGADKRNELSDIAACVGLLFFLVTNQKPEALRDHQQKKPHEREQARNLIQQLHPEVSAQLNRIFAVGFSLEVRHDGSPLANFVSSLPS